MEYLTVSSERIPNREYISDGIAAGVGLAAGYATANFFHEMPKVGASAMDAVYHYSAKVSAQIGTTYVIEHIGENEMDTIDGSNSDTIGCYIGNVDLKSLKPQERKGAGSRLARLLGTDVLVGGYIPIPFTKHNIDLYNREGKFHHKDLGENDAADVYRSAIDRMKSSDYWDDQDLELLDNVDLEFSSDSLGWKEFGSLGVSTDGSAYKISISPKLSKEMATIMTVRFLDEAYAMRAVDGRKVGPTSTLRALSTTDDIRAAGKYIGTLPTESNDIALKALKYEHTSGNNFLEDYTEGRVDVDDLHHVHIQDMVGNCGRRIWQKIKGDYEPDLYTEAVNERFKYDVEKAVLIAGVATLLPIH
ncbi:MAG: hypothetical protein QF415_08890 [Candidatus Undinarchaeales archaeon]|jgi:hypothetical protein|nr:hypothetical protein [Candidatus Undinarchaeales archaeon]MDP7494107.1 hypothetical protein [Candidatus Undinarchaeales archaeon]